MIPILSKHLMSLGLAIAPLPLRFGFMAALAADGLVSLIEKSFECLETVPDEGRKARDKELKRVVPSLSEHGFDAPFLRRDRHNALTFANQKQFSRLVNALLDLLEWDLPSGFATERLQT